MGELQIVVTNQPTDWLPGELACIARSRFGEIWMINLTEGDRTHSRPLFIDRGGTIAIIVDNHGNVVLENVWRPVCRLGQRIILPIRDPQAVLGDLGAMSLEFPRGYAKKLETATETGLRESREEVGLQTRHVTTTMLLGEAFLNGFNPQPNDFMVVVVNRNMVLEVPALARLREVIQGVEWVSEDQMWRLIADGEIRDQSTLTGWSLYQAQKKVHPELFQGGCHE
jgi:8-oxo-dGTP pyrophosphatase MutT (NUDIX family)